MPGVRSSSSKVLWAIGAIVLAAGLSACGSTVIKTVAVTQTQTVGSQPPPPPPPPPPAGVGSPSASNEARIGSAIVLHGNSDGEVVRVKILAVKDPFIPTGEFSLGPQPGQRDVAVKIALLNLGSDVYDDSPSNGTALIDTADQQYTDTALDQMSPDIGSPKIAPRDRRVGWMTFAVAKHARLKKLQFGLDSGFGPETGEWLLR